jgi:hypothetical protein
LRNCHAQRFSGFEVDGELDGASRH